MALVRVAHLSQIPDGKTLEVENNGETFVLCNVAGAIHAMDGICPHRGGRLAHGALHGATVVCPWHAWEFDCRTGEHDYNPEIRLRTFPVDIRDGNILLDLP